MQQPYETVLRLLTENKGLTRAGNPIVIAAGIVYEVRPENGEDIIRGHNGKTFVFSKGADGVLYSTNVWLITKVPDKYAENLNDNAILVQQSDWAEYGIDNEGKRTDISTTKIFTKDYYSTPEVGGVYIHRTDKRYRMKVHEVWDGGLSARPLGSAQILMFSIDYFREHYILKK